jgi:hypothetical protein
MRVLLVGGPADGSWVELRDGATRYSVAELPSARLRPCDLAGAEDLAARRTHYRVVPLRFAGSTTARFMAAPEGWTDADAVEELLRGYRGGSGCTR